MKTTLFIFLIAAIACAAGKPKGKSTGLTRYSAGGVPKKNMRVFSYASGEPGESTCRPKCKPDEYENRLGLCGLDRKCCMPFPVEPQYTLLPSESSEEQPLEAAGRIPFSCHEVGGWCQARMCLLGTWEDHSAWCPYLNLRCCRVLTPPPSRSKAASSEEDRQQAHHHSCSDLGGECRMHCKYNEVHVPGHHCTLPWTKCCVRWKD